MQDKDTEAINNQRKRRKRIGRIRNGIIMTIAGWIILSMILIIVLFVQVIKIQHKLDNIVTVSSKEQVQQENAQKPESAGESVYTDVTEATETPKTYESVTPPATGISEEENLASDGDIHKVYLTFEDGPSDNTGEILDILAQYDVKATFFVVGKEDEESKALYQRIVDEGHTLGMNSYSNQYSVIYQSEDAFEQDYMTLKNFLKKGGVIFITESNDRISTLAPDEKNLLGQFLDILKEDKYAGKRETGQAVPGWLTNCGYDHIHVWCKGISAAKGEQQQKEDIFQTFFSYLPEDVEILLAEEPDNRKYQDWQNWLKKNYEELQQLILSEESEITMGMQILSCEKGSL